MPFSWSQLISCYKFRILCFSIHFSDASKVDVFLNLSQIFWHKSIKTWFDPRKSDLSEDLTLVGWLVSSESTHAVNPRWFPNRGGVLDVEWRGERLGTLSREDRTWTEAFGTELISPPLLRPRPPLCSLRKITVSLSSLFPRKKRYLLSSPVTSKLG